jgi:DNA repair protein RecO
VRDPGRERVAIVLSAAPFGDDDRILRVLGPDEGRHGVFQRLGRRRPAGLDVGVCATLRLRGRGGGLDTLVEAEVHDARVRLRSSFLRLVLAQYGCELVGAFAREGQPEPKLYGLLETWLLVLDALDADPDPGLAVALELKTLTFAGVGPRLDRCAGCGEALDGPATLDPHAGGAHHARCGGGAPVSSELLGELDHLRRTPLRELVDTRVSEPAIDASLALLRAQLGADLATRALWRESGPPW